MHSVLWLILAFFNAAGLMVLVGAEFIAMLLVIVYVGAVAVLFLFVVMMLDIDFAELRAGLRPLSPARASRSRWCCSARSARGSARWDAGRHRAGRAAPRRRRPACRNIQALGTLLYTPLPVRVRGRRAWSCWSR